MKMKKRQETIKIILKTTSYQNIFNITNDPAAEIAKTIAKIPGNQNILRIYPAELKLKYIFYFVKKI